MASLNCTEDFSIEEFAAYINSNLPVYQRPYFVRLQHDMRITGTFKHQKVDYRKEGFDPAQVKDPLYFLDGKSFIPLDEELHRKLQSGEVAPR
jgi:fatty-acyl-CoA synthase